MAAEIQALEQIQTELVKGKPRKIQSDDSCMSPDRLSFDGN